MPGAKDPHALLPWKEANRIIELPAPAWESESAEPAVPLSHYFWVLRRFRWKIFAAVLLAVAATWAISIRITPIYEATATIDVDRQMPTGILGQEALRPVFNDSDQFLSTQIRILQSDSVLRPVVQKLRLDTMPDEAPERDTTQAFGAEAPIRLRNLKITRPPNTYLLLIAYRSANSPLAASVANEVARSYVEHTYHVRHQAAIGFSSFMERQLEELKAKMERSSAALVQFERELNVINPEEKTSILSARLLQLNTEFTNAQTERVKKETALNSIRWGSPEAAFVSSQGEAVRRLSEQLNEANRRFAEIKTYYGSNHPEHKKLAAQVGELQQQLNVTRQSIAQRVEIEYQEANRRELMLREAVAETKREFDGLNARSFEYQAFKREAEADKKLYEELVQKIKQAGINASFQNGAIRIADPARPAGKPVFPRTGFNVLLAFLISTVLAVGAAILADVLDDTVRDPERVQSLSNNGLIASLPSVRRWKGQLAPPSKSANGQGACTPVRIGRFADDHTGSYKEAILALRNSLLLANLDHPIRTLMFTSAAPGDGKSTAAANMAVACAEQRQRTLLIDGDMRRPFVHRIFGVASSPGLYDALTYGTPWQEAVVRLEAFPLLDVLPAGPASLRAGNVDGAALTRILESAAAEYDMVVVDSPPLLGLAEPLQMAVAADGVVVVVRAGATSRKAVAGVVSHLERLRANLVGIVLNQVNQDLHESYGYYSYVQKYYQAGRRS